MMKRIFYLILILIVPQIIVFGFITENEEEQEKEIKLVNYTKKLTDWTEKW